MRASRRHGGALLVGAVALAAAALATGCADGGTRGAADGIDAVSPDVADSDGGDVAPDAIGDDAAGDDAIADSTGEEVAADSLGDGGPDASETDALAEWSAPGPYRVGYRSEPFTYEANDGSGERTLRAAIWYPTRATTGDDVLYAGVLAATGVLGGAAPVADAGALPVVVFSHGNSGFAEQSFFLTELLATRGYLVIAIDHTGNTAFDRGGPPAAIFHWRPADVSAAIDHLEALPAGDALAGLASDRIAVAGHSFGGYTTLAVGGAGFAVDAVLAFCQVGTLPADACTSFEGNQALYRAGFLDARVDALIPMAPGATQVFGAHGVADVALPTLLMTGGMDRTTTNADEGDPTWAQLAARAGNLRVDLATAGHFTFSDACELPLGIGADDGCGPDNIPWGQAHAIINAYAVAFLARTLRGDDAGAAVLDGSAHLDDDVTVSVGAL